MLRRTIEELGVTVHLGVGHHGGPSRTRTAAVAAHGPLRRPAARRRPGGVLRRHPAPRRAGPRRRAGRRRARRHRRRRALPHRRRARSGRSASARWRRRTRSTAWSPPATRWPRWRPTGWPAATATFTGADTVDQAQAARRRRGQLRRRARHDRGCLDVRLTDPVTGVYEKLVISDDARRCSAASWSATRPPTRRCGAGVGGAAARRPPLCCPRRAARPARAGALPDEAAVCSCNNVTRATIGAAIADGAAPTCRR